MWMSDAGMLRAFCCSPAVIYSQIASWAKRPSLERDNTLAAHLTATASLVGGFAVSKTIPLTQGKVAIVDDADFESLSKHKWYYLKGYAVRKIRHDDKQRTIYMHHAILKPPLGFESDHLNGNGCDNRRCNLRSCTHSQNLRNSAKPAHRRGNICSSKYKGVTWHKPARKWQAQIKLDGMNRYLGLFNDEQEAALRYNIEATKLFGEFANLNAI